MKKKKTLKELREEKGYTYEEMAKQVGICKSYYWHIEHHNRRLYYDIAIKIAAVFGLHPDEINWDEN